ncbi:hypothetical protein [Enterococcus faecalis]|nr:hypothetical protein [Enterococcus faecalis]
MKKLSKISMGIFSILFLTYLATERFPEAFIFGVVVVAVSVIVRCEE